MSKKSYAVTIAGGGSTFTPGIALMLLCFLLLSGPVYQLLLSFGQSLFGSLSYDGYTAVSELANMGAYLVALLLPAFLYCRRIRIPRYNAFPLERSRDLRITLAAVPISLMAVVVGSSCASAMGSVFALFGIYPTSPLTVVPTAPVEFVLYFLGAALLPAVVEELVFRGAVMQSLRRFGDGFALLASSILFGLCHGNLVQAPMAFVTGLAIGYFVLRTGSLYTGILIHFVNNGLAVVGAGVLGAVGFGLADLLVAGPLTGIFRTCLYVCLAIALVGALSALILYLRFDIRTIFEIRSGIAARRTIQRMAEANARTGRLYREDLFYASDRLTGSFSGPLSGQETAPPPQYPTQPAAAAATAGDGGTELLSPAGDGGTELLAPAGNGNTTILSASDSSKAAPAVAETTILRSAAQRKPGFVFQVTQSVLLIHTDETI